jgi:hypothetical protein
VSNPFRSTLPSLTDRNSCYALVDAVDEWGQLAAQLSDEAVLYRNTDKDTQQSGARLFQLASELVNWCDQYARHIDPTPLWNYSKMVLTLTSNYHGQQPILPSQADLEMAIIPAMCVRHRVTAHAIQELEALAPCKESSAQGGRGQDVVDLTAFRPANEFLEIGRFDDFKAITKALSTNAWVRRQKPTPQRLEIHAGDWHRMRGLLSRGDPLDLPAEQVASAVEEVEIRKAAIRNTKKGEGA